MDLILFDCDGVLVDSEVIAGQVLAAEIGARIPALDQAAFAAGIFGVTDHDAVRSAEAEYGVRLPDGFVDYVSRTIHRKVVCNVEPVPGAAAAVEAVALPRAVVSNSSLHRVRQMLDRTGLRHFFEDRLFSAETVARPKPHPDVYLSAAETLGADPKCCIAVEDSVAGVTAAIGAGMTAIGFLGGGHIQPGHGNRLQDAGARLLCDTMADLGAAIDTITSGQ